jgi:hypothetical protein
MGEVWVEKTSLTPPLFIEKPDRKVSDHILVFGLLSLPLSTLCLMDFGTVQTVWYFCFAFRCITLC